MLGPYSNHRKVIGSSGVTVSNTQQTPFMRKAAVIRDQQPKQQRPYLTSNAPWVKRKIWSILYAVMDLLRNPAYAVPLLLNVTGSVWFFLLIGQAGELPSSLAIEVRDADSAAELSLTVPITNSLAFLFTVLGEWWAEGKVISRGMSKPGARTCRDILMSKSKIHGSECLSYWVVSLSAYMQRPHENPIWLKRAFG